MNGLAIMLSLSAINVDYGWQQLSDGQIEYIIQIDPSLVQALEEGEEIVSEIPPEVAGVRRFRIRIGRDTLPRESGAARPGIPGAGAASGPQDDPASRPPVLRPGEREAASAGLTDQPPADQPPADQGTGGAFTLPPPARQPATEAGAGNGVEDGVPANQPPWNRFGADPDRAVPPASPPWAVPESTTDESDEEAPPLLPAGGPDAAEGADNESPPDSDPAASPLRLRFDDGPVDTNPNPPGEALPRPAWPPIDRGQAPVAGDEDVAEPGVVIDAIGDPRPVDLPTRPEPERAPLRTPYRTVDDRDLPDPIPAPEDEGPGPALLQDDQVRAAVPVGGDDEGEEGGRSEQTGFSRPDSTERAERREVEDRTPAAVPAPARRGTLLATSLALFASLAVNAYLGWLAFSVYRRYQALSRDIRFTDAS